MLDQFRFLIDIGSFENVIESLQVHSKKPVGLQYCWLVLL